MYTQTQVLDDSDFDDLPPVNSRVKLGILKTVDRDYEIFIGLNCIGRADICDIVINHPSVSGKHAIIEVEDQESHIIYDCGSTNKTKLGKAKLKPNIRYNLQDGDVITFGFITGTYVKVNETPAQTDDDSGSDTGSESLFCDSIVPETPYQTKLVNLVSSEVIVAETPDSSKNVSENEDSFLTSTASVSNMETPSVNRSGSNKIKNNIKGTKLDFVDETISETVSTPPELVLGPDVFGDDDIFDDDIILATQPEQLNNSTFSNDNNDANSSIENISIREELMPPPVNLNESLNFKIRQVNQNENESQDSIFNLSTQVPKSQRFSDILFFSQDASFSRKSGQPSVKNEETANVLQLLESRDPIFEMETQESVSDKNVSPVCVVKEQVSSRRTSNRIKLASCSEKAGKSNTTIATSPTASGDKYKSEVLNLPTTSAKCKKSIKRSNSKNNHDVELTETNFKLNGNKTVNGSLEDIDCFEALTQINSNLQESNRPINREERDVQDSNEDEIYNAKTQKSSHPLSPGESFLSNKNIEKDDKVVLEALSDEDEIYNAKTQVASRYPICEVSACTSNKNTDTEISKDVYLALTQVNHNLLEKNVSREDRDVKDNTDDLEEEIYNAKTQVAKNYPICEVSTDSKDCTSNTITDTETNKDVYEALTQINYNLGEKNLSEENRDIKDSPDNIEVATYNAKTRAASSKISLSSGKNTTKTPLKNEVKLLVEDKVHQNTPFEFRTPTSTSSRKKKLSKVTDNKLLLSPQNITQNPLSIMNSKTVDRQAQNPTLESQVADSEALTQVNTKLSDSKSNQLVERMKREEKTSLYQNPESLVKMKSKTLESKEKHDSIFEMDTQVPDFDALTQMNPKLSDSIRKSSKERKTSRVKTSVVENPESLLEDKEKLDPIFEMDTQVPDFDELTQINPKLNDSKNKLTREKRNSQVKASTEKNIESVLEDKEMQNPIFDMDTQVPDSDALTQINPKLNDSKNKPTRERKSRQVKASTKKNIESVLEDKEMQNPIFDMDTQVPDSDALTQINPKLNDSKNKPTRERKSRQVKNSTEKNLESILENKETQNRIFDMDTQVPDSDALTQINPKLNSSKSRLNSGKKSRQMKNSTGKNLESVLDNKETQNPIFDMDTQVPDSDALTQINPKLNSSKSKLNSGKKSRQVKNSTEKNLESVLDNKETQNPIFDMDTQVPDSDALIQINPKLSNSKSKLIREKRSRQVKTSVVKNLEAVFEGKNTQQHPIFEMDTQLPDSDVLTQVNTKISDKSRTSKNKCEVKLKRNETNKSVHDIQRSYNEAASTRLEDDDLEDALTQINYNLQEKHPNRNVQNNQVEFQKSKTQVSSCLSFSKSTPISPKDKQIFKALTQINHSLQEKNESEVNRSDQNDDDSSTDIDEDLIFSAKPNVSNSAPVNKNKDAEEADVFEALTQINYNLEDKNVVGVNKVDQNIDDNSTDIDEDLIFNATKVSSSASVSKILPVNKNKEAEETDVFEALTQINYNLEDKNVCGINRDDENIDDNSTDIDEDLIFNATKVSSSASVSKILPASKNKGAEDTGVSEALTQINYNLQDKSGQNVNMDVELPGIRRLPIPKTCAINNLDIDEENHESESILAIVSDDLDDMDDEDNLFEVTHSDKNKKLLDCVSNKQLKNNNKISKTEMSMGDNFSNDEMISQYSENSFNLPPSDVLLEAVANFEATSTPGKKPLYTDDEDEEEIINSPRATRRTSRIRKPTNKVGKYLDSCTTIKKVAEKKNLKIKTNDSLCIEKAQKEAVEMKNLVVKLKPISVGEIELFTGQKKLKENNSKEILDDRVTSSLKSENASKKYSAEEEKLMEVRRKVCESEKRVDNIKENSGENTRERPENEGREFINAVQNENNDRSNKRKIKGEKPNNLLLMDTTKANQSIKVNDAGNSSSYDVREINTSKVENVPFVTKSTRNRKVSRSEEKDETMSFKTGQHEKSYTNKTKTGTSSAKAVDTSKTEQHEKSHTNKTKTGTSSAKAVDTSKTEQHEKSHTNKTKTGTSSAKAVDTSKTEQHEKSHTNKTKTGTSSAKAVDTSKTEQHETSHANKTKTGTSSAKAVDTSKTEQYEKSHTNKTKTGTSSAKAVDTSKTEQYEKSHTNNTKTGTSSAKAVDTSKTEVLEKANNKDTEKKLFFELSHSTESSETLGKGGTEKVTRRGRIPKKDLRNETKEGSFRITRSTLKVKEVNEKESMKIHSKLEKKDETVNSNKKYADISLDRPTRRKPENLKEQSSSTEITNISKSDSTHSFEDEKGKRVCRKTKGENNLTDDIPVKKSKRIAAQKQPSTIITVDLVESNEESDLEPLSKIKKRGKNVKNLTPKSKRAKYESFIQPETGATIIEPNSSVVYDSPSSFINTKTDSLLVECTTSYKPENLYSKADKVNKIVKKNTTAQRKRNIDEFFLPVASTSRLKDSVSCDSEEKTSSFSNNSRSSVHSISSPTTRHIGRRKEKVLFTTDTADPKLMAIVTKLGCTIVNDPHTCTVLVADKIRRTVKVLCCIGQGKPIVSPYWIEESKYVGIVQDPWKFLTDDKEAENKHDFSLKRSLNMANKAPMLKNYSFHATPSVRPPPCELRGIVEACGGAFLDEIPKLWPENSVIISCNEDRNLWEKMKSNTVPLIVTAEALIGGVLQQNLNLKHHTLS